MAAHGARKGAVGRGEDGRGQPQRELAAGGRLRLRGTGGAKPLDGVAAGAAEGLPGAGARARTGLVGGTAGVEGSAVAAGVACVHGPHDRGLEAHYVSQ